MEFVPYTANFLPKVVKVLPQAIPALIKRVNPTPAIIGAVNKVNKVSKIRAATDPFHAALPFHVPEWEDFDPMPSSAFVVEPATLADRLNEETQDLLQYSVAIADEIKNMKDELAYHSKFLDVVEKDSEKHLATVVQVARLQLRIDRFEKEYKVIDRRWRRCAKAKAIAVRVNKEKHAKNEAAWIKAQVNKRNRR